MISQKFINLSVASNVLDSIVAWVESGVTFLLDAFGNQFTKMTSPDTETFDLLFPFMKTAYDAVMYFGLALLFLIVIWQLFKSFGGKIVEGEDPAVLTVRAMLFAVLIFFSRDIMDYLSQIAMIPFNIFQEWDAQDVAENAILNMLVERDDGSFGLALVNVLNDILKTAVSFVSGISILGVVLTIVLLWNYLKLLLEVCERYVVFGILTYTSPLAFSLGASKATSDAFKNWCRMVGSQLFIIVMNVYLVKGFDVAFGTFSTAWTVMDDNNNTLVTFLIGYFCLIAYLRVASRFDEYLGQLGLNAAKTGTSPLGGPIAAMVGKNLLSSITGKGFAGGTGAGMGSASKVLGATGIGRIASRVGAGVGSVATIASNATSFSQGFKDVAKMMAGEVGNAWKTAVNPNTYVGNALTGENRGFGGLGGAAATTLGGFKASAFGLGDAGLISKQFHSADGNLMPIRGQAALNDAKTYMPNIFNREGLTFDANSQMNSVGKFAGQFETGDGKAFGFAVTNEKPEEGSYAVGRAVDGSGFYVQAFGSDGKVSEEGMSALFGAPEIGNGAGQIPSEDFANTFFPGEENLAGLTFSNDPNDSSVLTAEGDGRSLVGYNMATHDIPEDAEGFVADGADGSSYFFMDTTPSDVGGVESGNVSFGDDGLYDGRGVAVSDNVLDSLNAEPVAGATFDNSSAERYNGFTVNDSNPNEMFASPYNENGDSYVGDSGEIAANRYENIGNISNLSEAELAEQGIAKIGDGYYSKAPEGFVDSGIHNEAYNSSVEKDGETYVPLHIADNGDAYKAVASDAEIAAPVFNGGYEATFVPGNPNEVVLTNPETGEHGLYRELTNGVPDGVSEESVVTNKAGKMYAPVSMGTYDERQLAEIKTNNALVAKELGLSAKERGNMLFADTSKKSDGVTEVHYKNGTSKTYISEKGAYEAKGNSVGKHTAPNGDKYSVITGYHKKEEITTIGNKTNEVTRTNYSAEIARKEKKRPTRKVGSSASDKSESPKPKRLGKNKR